MDKKNRDSDNVYPLFTVAPWLSRSLGSRNAKHAIAVVILLLFPTHSKAADQLFPEAVPGRIIVRFKDSLTASADSLIARGQSFASALTDGSTSLDQLNAAVGVTAATPLFMPRNDMSTDEANQAFEAMFNTSKSLHPRRTLRIVGPDPPSLANIYALTIPQDSNPFQTCAMYNADPHVEYCQPDIVQAASVVRVTPNDPYFSSRGSWGQSYADLWGAKNLRTQYAWVATQGEGTVVAVVDSGVDLNHPDIAANIWSNPNEIPENGIDDDGNGYVDDVVGWDFVDDDATPQDVFGHGTHVAGIIAAVGDNGQGVIGVAPQAKIMVVRGLDANGTGSISALSQAVVYAAMTGADVINNSWGCSSRCPSNPVAEDAVRVATGLGAAVVFAAGNSADDVFNYSPENMTDPFLKPIVVAANDHLHRESVFPVGDPPRGTNYGMTVDLSAPGGGGGTFDFAETFRDVLSLRLRTCDPDTNVLCPNYLLVGDGYLRQAGTSMAAPHAAGAAALMLSCNPGMTPTDVRHVLQAAGRYSLRSAKGSRIGGGEIRADRAVSFTASPLYAFFGSPTPRQIIHPNSPPVDVTGLVLDTEDDRYLRYWRLEIGDGSTPARWQRLATGHGFVSGTLATFDPSLESGGVKTLRMLVKASLPTQRTLTCGEQREVATHRTRYVRAVQQVVVEPPVERVTTDDTKEYRYPTVSGTRIAAEEHPAQSGSSLDIYVTDVDSGGELRLGGPGSGRPRFDPDNPDHMVYLAPSPDQPGNEVYMYTFSTGETRRLSFDGSSFHPLDISGDHVLWKHGFGPTTPFRLYDLATGATEVLPLEVRSGNSLSLSGQRIVYVTGAVDSGFGLAVYDLGTRQASTVLPDVGIFSPSIRGSWVSFFATSGGNPTAYNVATGEVRALSGFRGFPAHVVNDGTIAAWEALISRSEQVLMVAPLSGAGVTQITYDPASLVSQVAIDDRRVVWRDSREGHPNQIWTYVVP